MGANSKVMYVEKLTLETGTPVQWPVIVGTIPVLASAFQPRAGLRQAVDEARRDGHTVVLASDNPDTTPTGPGTRTPVQVMTGGGGVGKTQLAAAYAREALKDGTDLVLWTPATESQQILTTYAQAALRVRAPGCTGEDMQADAQAFLNWLAATDRHWLVVLDDVTDLDAIEPWWPDSQRGTGWALTTTRLKDPRLTGGGRRRVEIDVYTPEEADVYLQARLTSEAMAHLLDDRSAALAEALGHLPLALSHAAAYMLRENTHSATYLQRFIESSARLDEVLPPWADTERYGRQITTTLLLALDATDQDPHGALARAALHITALLDPTGHPAALWHTPALTAHLATHQRPHRPHRVFLRRRTPQPTPVTGDDVQAALRLLHRYSLITYDTTADQHHAVRIHPLTARAMRETTTEDQQPPLATAVADALLQIWPEIDPTQPELATTLRANTSALADHTHNHLWHSEGHYVLYRAGRSLLNAGLVASATTYWQNMVTTSHQLLGDDNPHTLAARVELGVSYVQEGHIDAAIDLLGRVVVDSERLLGSDHSSTHIVRGNLAAAYWQAGRTDEAIELQERVVADSTRLLGSDHPDTLTGHGNLAVSYGKAGRTDEAMHLLEQVVADRERLLGDNHPHTLITRSSLATAYRQAGCTNESIGLLEQVVADCERVLGNDHPDTLAARGNLANSYQQAGRTRESIAIEERMVAEWERVLGGDHPNTLGARGRLAILYRQTGRVSEAIELLQRLVADIERHMGPDHPNSEGARAALSQWQALEK
ncbi:FxSxx-COOH system tetratricopeptide repeat protein [Streptomyces fagopyri]|uniref:FxSxx-COOH system tetratricopeptide repeat protein n=1 Tax=Streptomyces fagopyri TaxID=2662397 RepID=UPI0037F144A9